MPYPKLEVKNISKFFPGVRALKDVSVSVQKGEIVSLVGENGAGKSTLINVISGQIKPDEGELFLDGKHVRIETPTDAVLLGIGLVPQELNLMPQMSVAENIFLGTKKLRSKLLRNIDWKSIRADSEKVLEKLGMSIDVTQYVGGMSVASQQMVQIARALCLGADILIFDEPTACLTLKESGRLLTLIKQFREEGKSVIFVSHHLDQVIDVSDRVFIMRDGANISSIQRDAFSVQRLIRDMAGEEVTQSQILRREVGNEPILKVDGLSRAREFNNIHFDINKGEIFGIAGLVGAGRTELISTIFGDRKPDKGSIWFDSEVLHLRSPQDAISKGMGYIPEERRNFGILPTMSISENLTIALIKRLFRFPKIDRKREKRLVEEYCGKVRVKMASPNGLLTKLSGGNQQKVIIARWLATDCKMLIMDEPTRGIDILAKNEIHQLMRQCADNGMTVLAVSAEMEELISICNRILIMHEGNQKEIVDAKDMTPEKILHIALA